MANSATEPEADVQLLEEVLGVELPSSYREFLLTQGNATVFGLPVLGLPLSLEETSVWGATELVRARRPDLGPSLVAIRLMNTRALCLDLRGAKGHDAPLIEVPLQGDDPPNPVHESFARYLQAGLRSERHIEGALKHIRWLVEQGDEYDHALPDARPPYRAHHWRVMRSCVHDHVVGLTAIRHNEAMNALEVDVFLNTDHPEYEPGHGVRALAVLLLSDAYRNGASMEIRFTRWDRDTRQRIPVRLLGPLAELARSSGISFVRAAEGVIAHQEAVRLYAALVGLPAQAIQAVERYEASRFLTLEGLCYLVSAGLWTVEEASWIVLNFPEPHRVLFGADVPEVRLPYVEALSYGRAALAATRLCQRLTGGDVEAQGSCGVEIVGAAWRITPHDPCELGWAVSGDALSLVSGQPIVVLSRPRILFPDEEKRILEETRSFPASDNGATRFLLYASDHGRLSDLRGLAAQVASETGIGILILPFTCQELDEEVDRRMARARVLRP